MKHLTVARQVPIFVLVTLAPESPWFLVRRGRLEEAKRVICRLASKNSPVDPDHMVAYMVRTNQHEVEVAKGTSYLDCFKGVDLRRTEIACAAWAAQATCGLPFGASGTYFMQQSGFFRRSCADSQWGWIRRRPSMSALRSTAWDWQEPWSPGLR